jgi:hypothetical protein
VSTPAWIFHEGGGVGSLTTPRIGSVKFRHRPPGCCTLLLHSCAARIRDSQADLTFGGGCWRGGSWLAGCC